MKLKNICEELFKFAPLDSMMKWDNAGLLIGDKEREINKILLALDCTNSVIAEAKNISADLIISHHPLFFDLGRSLVKGNHIADKVIDLVKSDIAVIAMHTNADIAEGGVNDMLLEQIELPIKEKGIVVGKEDGIEYNIGRYAVLERKMPIEEFAQIVAESTNCTSLRCVGNTDVEKFAVGGGACSSFAKAAYSMGCDTFITGEVKHHTYLMAQEMGKNILDIGHFESERMLVKALEKLLKNAFDGVEVVVSESFDDFIVKHISKRGGEHAS